MENLMLSIRLKESYPLPTYAAHSYPSRLILTPAHLHTALPPPDPDLPPPKLFGLYDPHPQQSLDSKVSFRVLPSAFGGPCTTLTK